MGVHVHETTELALMVLARVQLVLKEGFTSEGFSVRTETMVLTDPRRSSHNSQ